MQLRAWETHLSYALCPAEPFTRPLHASGDLGWCFHLVQEKGKLNPSCDTDWPTSGVILFVAAMFSMFVSDGLYYGISYLANPDFYRTSRPTRNFCGLNRIPKSTVGSPGEKP